MFLVFLVCLVWSTCWSLNTNAAEKNGIFHSHLVVQSHSNILVVSPQSGVGLQVARSKMTTAFQLSVWFMRQLWYCHCPIAKECGVRESVLELVVGGSKCFCSCCHCKPPPKNTSSFNDTGPDKVRLPIDRLWFAEDRRGPSSAMDHSA